MNTRFAALSLSLAATACGGGPDLDAVKADFENPSGSVSNKEAVIASNGQRDAQGPAVAVAGGGVPGLGLTAFGKPVGLQQINVRRTWESRIRATHDYVNGRASASQALSAAQFEATGCDNSAEAQAAYEEAFGDIIKDSVNPFGNSKKISGKASYTQDLSSCSGGELKGTIKVDFTIELEQTGEESGRFAFTLDYELIGVCELTTEQQACLDGQLIMEAEAVGDGANSVGRLTFTSAWNLHGTWIDEGVSRDASMKGGLRSFFEGNGEVGTAKIEYLNYVTTPEGKEYSYVWTFEATNDRVTWECRGNDGYIRCEITETMASCTGSDGSSAFTWTAEDEAGLDEGWFD
jgi:hypothetical protein